MIRLIDFEFEIDGDRRGYAEFIHEYCDCIDDAKENCAMILTRYFTLEEVEKAIRAERKKLCEGTGLNITLIGFDYEDVCPIKRVYF